MGIINRARCYIAKPDAQTSLALFFIGIAIYFVGALVLVNRAVFLGGLALSAFAMFNYVRTFGRKS